MALDLNLPTNQRFARSSAGKALANVEALVPSTTDMTTAIAAGGGGGIPPTLIDAKGDLIVGSAADTAARLAAGTDTHVLTANSAAPNGVEWAAPSGGGGLTHPQILARTMGA